MRNRLGKTLASAACGAAAFLAAGWLFAGEAAPKEGAPKAVTEAEVAEAINAAGKTPPDWWEKVTLNYPKTLDLAGTKTTKGPQENLEAYLRGPIQADPNKWRGGIKLLAEVVNVRKDDAAKQAEAMGLLARAYYDYEHDWLRAAFWWRSGIEKGLKPGTSDLAGLADCYRRHGCRAAAVALLKQHEKDTRPPDLAMVKTLAMLGESAAAKGEADRLAAARGQFAGLAYLKIAHELRSAGDNAAAAECYQKAIDAPLTDPRTKERAKLAMDATKALEKVDLAKTADGTYTGTGKGLRGPIEVEVTVKDKRITAVKVTKKQDDAAFISRAERVLPGRVVENQGLRDVDTVTGATFSSEGILNAVANALGSTVK